MELLLPALLLVVGYCFGSLRVLRQYERGVSFFLGKLLGHQGAGPDLRAARLRPA